jgi:quercetin dioxygenase-like cupin family protein
MAFHLFQSSSDQNSTLHIPGLGLELTVQLPPRASDSALSIIETTNAPGFGPPLHRHHETEIFRVLEGRYLFEVDGERFEAGEGEVICVPGDAAHAFVNITGKPARQFIVIAPGMDAYTFFSSLGDVFAKGRPTKESLNEFGKPWGVEFLGPPLAVPR